MVIFEKKVCFSGMPKTKFASRVIFSPPYILNGHSLTVYACIYVFVLLPASCIYLGQFNCCHFAKGCSISCHNSDYITYCCKSKTSSVKTLN